MGLRPLNPRSAPPPAFPVSGGGGRFVKAIGPLPSTILQANRHAQALTCTFRVAGVPRVLVTAHASFLANSRSVSPRTHQPPWKDGGPAVPVVAP